MKLIGRITRQLEKEAFEVELGTSKRRIEISGTQLEPDAARFVVGTRVIVHCTPQNVPLFAWVPIQRLGKVKQIFQDTVSIVISSGDGDASISLPRCDVFGSLSDGQELTIYCGLDHRPFFAEKLS
jgi:hypothetical protein